MWRAVCVETCREYWRLQWWWPWWRSRGGTCRWSERTAATPPWSPASPPRPPGAADEPPEPGWPGERVCPGHSASHWDTSPCPVCWSLMRAESETDRDNSPDDWVEQRMTRSDPGRRPSFSYQVLTHSWPGWFSSSELFQEFQTLQISTVLVTWRSSLVRLKWRIICFTFSLSFLGDGDWELLQTNQLPEIQEKLSHHSTNLNNSANFHKIWRRKVFVSPISGSFSEVGGILSPITIKKTVMESRVVIPNVT